MQVGVPLEQFVTLRRAAMTMADYAAATGESWKTAFPARQLGKNQAIRHGGMIADFEAKLDDPVPECGVIDSASLLVAGVHGTICTADGTILPEQSWFRGHFAQMQVTDYQFKVHRLKGSAVSILSDWSDSSYGHFIQDSLPRLAMLEKLKIDVAGFDYIICGVPTEFCMNLLEKIGIDRRKILRPIAGVALQADRLVVPSFPGARRNMESWAGAYFNHKFPVRETPSRRIYILRRTRKPVMEEALLEILRPHGFEVYAPESDQENQAKVFSQAEMIIGTAGSAMANLAFCKAGTRVLELLPSDHVFPYYYAMSAALGLEYRYIVGESLVTRGDNSIGASNHDFNLCEDVFRQALAQLLR